MGRSKKNEEVNANEVNEEVKVNEVVADAEVVSNENEQAEVTSAKGTERANRIAVQVTDTGFIADFYRTHKHIKKVLSADTDFKAEENDTKTAQRESFRKYMIEHANEHGVSYDPCDKRTDGNLRPAKYDNDEALIHDAIAMVEDKDVPSFIEALPEDISKLIVSWSVDDDGITPMKKTPKGIDLSKLGITDGKYANGNWAWATIGVSVVVKLNNEREVYVPMECSLVSGQLKKPTKIDGGGYTKTSFANTLRTDLEEIGVLAKEDKTEEVKEEK